MKAKYFCGIAAAAMMSVMCATAANAQTTVMKNGSAFIEAESGDLKTYCKVEESEEASGGKYVRYGEKAAKIIEQPKLATDKAIEYEFDVDYASRFYVWVRVRAEDAKTDGISVIINNQAITGTVGSENFGKFTWIQLGQATKGYILQQGINKISVVPKSTGVELDEILITRKRATPEGKNTIDDTLDMYYNDPRRFNMDDNGYSKQTIADEMQWNVPDIKPVEGHPRVNLRKEDIPKILENAQKPENQSAWQMHLTYVEDTSAKPTTEMIEAKALDYQLRGNVEAGKAAVREAVDFYKKNGQSYMNMTGDAYNQIGLAVRTLAEVYDWCYDLITDEEKAYIVDEMIMLMSQGNNGELQWPLYTQNVFTAHQAEGLLQLDVMSMAIAIYDEREDIYNFHASRFFNEVVEYRKWLFESYTFNQGLNYLDYRLKYEGMSTWLIDKGLGIENVYGDGFAKVPYRRLYMYRPDGFWFQDADSDTTGWSTQSLGEMVTWLVASYYKDPYLKQAYLESKTNACSFSYRSSVTNGQITTGQWLLFNDPDLEGRSERELPLSMYYPSPGGIMSARTGWTYGDESPTVAVDMKIKETFVHGHDHMDSGSFQIYYKGLLARESGLYKSTNIGYKDGYNIGSSQFLSEHHTFFHTRSIAHNTMRVYDPDEEFWGDRNERTWTNTNQPYELDKIPNDGGQRQVALTYETDFETLKEEGAMGKVMAHEYGEDQIEPDFTYLKGDLAGAYSDKIDEYERSFMFLNQKNDEHPATLIVFDRIDTSNKSFKKTWQMYGTDTEPQVSGTRAVITDTRTEQGGKIQYNGRLTIDTLMPAADNVEYNVIGGDGQWAVVDGVSYEAAMLDKNQYRDEAHNYRLEISPKEESELDYFLNVMQIDDADGGEQYETTLIETDDLAGCVIGENVVLFGKRKDRTKENVNFRFDGEGTFKITVADMESGTWSAYRNGAYVGDYGVTTDGGVLYLTGEAGEYTFAYKNDTPKVYAEPTLEKQSRISMHINSRPAYMEEPAYIKDDGTLMIPLRNVFERFGADIEWDSETDSVKAALNGVELYFKAGSSQARKVFGDTEYSIQLGSELEMKNGVMMVPTDAVPYITNGVSYTLNELSYRLDITSEESENNADIADGGKFREDGTDNVYAFGDLAHVDEVILKGEPGKTYNVEYSFDGEDWTALDAAVTCTDDGWIAVHTGIDCGYIRIISDGEMYGCKFMMYYLDNTYDSVVNVEWSSDNGSKETGWQAIDGDESTLWSSDGPSKYLIFDLGIKKEHEGMEVLWNKGNERKTYFNVLGSNDKENWTYIIEDGVTDGVTAGYEKTEFKNSSAYRYIKLEMFGTSTGTWNGIKEIRFLKEAK